MLSSDMCASFADVSGNIAHGGGFVNPLDQVWAGFPEKWLKIIVPI
jgi:hypothetical protein